LRRLARAAIAAAAAALPLLAGCNDDCCTVVDSYPIQLTRAPMGGPLAGVSAQAGALVAVAAKQNAGVAQSFPMLIDTGTPVTVLGGAAGSKLQTFRSGFDLYDAPGGPSAPLRAQLRGVDMLQLPLQPVGDGSVIPGGLFGGDLLRAFSVAFRFGATCPTGPGLCSSMTLWPHLGADESFLEDAGYAVIRFSLFGGGEVTADGDPDFLGLRGPLELPATRIVLRTCGVPTAFDPASFAHPACCTADQARGQASGVDLALLVDTGVGPLVLSQSAWDRVLAKATAQAADAQAAGDTTAQPPPAPTDRMPSLLVATWPSPISASWSTIPRFALVDLEAGGDRDPGPCVELARSRRTEWLSWETVNHPENGACFQPCDADPDQSNEAQNSAAYIELGGAIPVAIVDDDEPFLQAIRFDVRPEGPEVDGVVGAGALGRARVEIDYQSSSPRALFSCEIEGVPRTACYAAARCPRLPDHDHQHLCFGLGLHGLAPTCAPSGC
jgi:hypothetical protein